MACARGAALSARASYKTVQNSRTDATSLASVLYAAEGTLMRSLTLTSVYWCLQFGTCGRRCGTWILSAPSTRSKAGGGAVPSFVLSSSRQVEKLFVAPLSGACCSPLSSCVMHASGRLPCLRESGAMAASGEQQREPTGDFPIEAPR